MPLPLLGILGYQDFLILWHMYFGHRETHDTILQGPYLRHMGNGSFHWHHNERKLRSLHGRRRRVLACRRLVFSAFVHHPSSREQRDNGNRCTSPKRSVSEPATAQRCRSGNPCTNTRKK